MLSSYLGSIFFKFLAFFRPVLVVSYLQIQQTKICRIIEILLYHFLATFKVSRPVVFETEMRPETFETETCKNGSRDASQDSITTKCIKMTPSFINSLLSATQMFKMEQISTLFCSYILFILDS